MALKDSWIARNLLWGVIYGLSLIIVVSVGLRIITRHGQTVQAPDFTSLTVPQAQQLAHRSHVSVKVVDSVFVKRLPGGVVYRQQPKAGAMVKKGRSIFLTINSIVPRKVVMPNLYGYSVNEARSELQNRGLNLGTLTYVKDIATNTVLEQYVGGVAVEAGELVVSGSTVDLTVGVAREDNRTVIPNVTGMKYVNAVDELHAHYLNVGTMRFDPGIKTYTDSLNAVVYKQDTPGAGRSLGARVNLALKKDGEE